MSIFRKIIRFITDSKYRFNVLHSKGFYNLIGDKAFLAKQWKVKMSTNINFNNPHTFNEKLQWLKLNDRKKEYTLMVDKNEAKQYVSKIIGEKHIIKTFGVYSSFSEIDFKKLPNKFVLKTTHDSGCVFICKDKTTFDYSAAKKALNKSLKRNFYYENREWPYKNVSPRIIAEEFLESKSGAPLIDYKFYCFNGEGPKFLYVSKGLDNHSTASISFLNLDWSFAPYERIDYKPFEALPNKPKRFQEMVRISKELSKDTFFLRVDLYEVDDEVYFSELTFSPCAGYMPFKNKEHDLEIGKMLKLPL